MALLWIIGLLLVGLGVWWWLWWQSEEGDRQPRNTTVDRNTGPPPTPPPPAVPTTATTRPQAVRTAASPPPRPLAVMPQLAVVAPPGTVAANDATIGDTTPTAHAAPMPALASEPAFPSGDKEQKPTPEPGLVPPPEPNTEAASTATDAQPAVLAQLRWLRHEELPETEREALAHRLRVLPRPPLTVHQVLSPDFVETTNSIDLSIMIKGQPAITAKVLGTVNSPLYGLLQPVTHTGQAITFLGLNTVRNLCLQYMLMAPISGVAARRQAVLDNIGQSITLASELCTRLSQKLQWPDASTLVTQVVLYFLGQLVGYGFWPGASASTDVAANTWALPLPERMTTEIEQLGLSAAEMGALLLQEWQIPAELVQEVRDIDRIVLTPASELDEARGVRLALCYLCIRLGERIARCEEWEPEHLLHIHDATDAEWFHLQSYLQHPALHELDGALQIPELHATLRALRSTAPMRL
ncbi:MAG: HDOD domain-containing protein [Macromonas sp.]